MFVRTDSMPEREYQVLGPVRACAKVSLAGGIAGGCSFAGARMLAAERSDEAMDDVIRLIKEEAARLGADGVIGFESTVTLRDGVELTGSGFAIRLL